METEYRVGAIRAADAGAPHRRERIWILAYANVERLEGAKSVGVRNDQLQRTRHQSREHPIGQLADPDVFGRLHGQVEERTAIGGIHALGEPEPSGEDVADAGINNVEGLIHSGTYQEERCRQVERPAESRGDGLGWWSTEPGLGGNVDGLAKEMDRT